MIELSNVGVIFTGRSKHPALDRINLSVEPSSVTVLLGPNGAGKTTLLRVLGRTLLPSSGTYRLWGKNAVTDRSVLNDIAFAQEGDRSLQLRYTGRDNIELYLAQHGVRARRSSIDDIASRFELQDWLDKEARLYSKGMRQKLCLIGPLLIPARVILLDEPTVGLDAESLDTLVQTLRTLRDEGRAVIIATHEIEFARSVFTNVVVLSQGRVLADLDDRSFRAVAGGHRFIITVRDVAIPALAGWSSSRGERGEIVLSRDGATPADLQEALTALLHAGVLPTSVSSNEPSFDIVYRRILTNAQFDRDLDEVQVQSVSERPIRTAL